LIARARIADSLGLKDESARLHARLAEGDFSVGDRIILAIEGPYQRADTAVVQAGKIIALGSPMGDMSLNGLLRSELADSISARISKYFKNETVHATPLIRIGIGGAVRIAGFHYVRRDMPLSDLVTRAGGLDQNADASNIVITRGSTVLYQKADVMSAMQDGLTLDRLGLEPGDQIIVAARPGQSKWMLFLQYGVPIITAVLLPIWLQHR
jgi:protein involved in polysaccharide export with SLBB domain